MRLATAAKLAHSLDAEGRQGEWASEAACECLLARGAAVDKAAGCERRGAGGLRRGASTRDPYPPLPSRGETDEKETFGSSTFELAYFVRLLRKCQVLLRPSEHSQPRRLVGAFDGLGASPHPTRRPPCNARVSLLSCTSKHGAPAIPLQTNAMPHTHLPWHNEPQLHARKATAAHDNFPRSTS